MNATEEYLDKLLRGVSGLPDIEEETEPEEILADDIGFEPESETSDEVSFESEPEQGVVISDINVLEDALSDVVDLKPDVGLTDDICLEPQILQDEVLPEIEPIGEIETEIPALASDAGDNDGFSIVDEADALLSDLPLLDIPEDTYENDEEISITSGIPVSIPVAADVDTYETVIDTAEELISEDIPSEFIEHELTSADEATAIPAEEQLDEVLEELQDEVSNEETKEEALPDIIGLDEAVPADILSDLEKLDDAMTDETLPDITIGDEVSEPLEIKPESFDESVSENVDELPTLDEMLEGVSSVDESLSDSLGSTGLEDIFNEENLEDEDIAALLKDIENMGKEEASIDNGSDALDIELEDMLSESDDADMSEIGDILIKDENNIPVDESLNEEIDFTSGMLSEEELFDDMEDILLDEDNKKGKKKKKKKRIKKSKETDDLDESGEIKEKKKGFFARLLDVLVASDDEDEEADSSVKFEESAVDIAVEGAAENDNILAELEQAGDSKKKKKDKKKKDKKSKNKGQASDGDFDEDGAPSSEKAKKKAEKEKKKAEKARIKAEQKEKEALMPKKKLPKKKVIPICILCFSLGVVITLGAFLMPSAFDKKQAKEQYDQHNYEETYSLLKGHSLSEKEQLMYDRTVTLLQEERKLDSYNNYMLLDMKPEALNALVQGIKKYDELSDKASELEVTGELNSIYNQIVNELNNTFGVPIEKARQWINIEDVEEYSYIINTYARGEQNSVIEGMEEDNQSGMTEMSDNPVISAEEAEIQ